MKNKLLRKATCLLLSACMALSLAGCKENDQPVDSTAKTTKSTTTTTTTTTTTATTAKKRKIDGNDKLIALTFDDGPYSPVTNRILDTLEKNDAVATFFVVGNRVDDYKSSVKRAADMGCEIGSHTFSHKNLNKLTADGMNSEISKSIEKIKSVTGKDVEIVRPPEGAANQSVRNAVKYPLIMWNVDSLDWKNRDATKDYDSVMSSVSDGCIILMHDLYPATADAVAKFVPELAAKGYKFVTVSEMLEARGVDMQSGTKYFSAAPHKPVEAPASSNAPAAE